MGGIRRAVLVSAVLVLVAPGVSAHPPTCIEGACVGVAEDHDHTPQGVTLSTGSHGMPATNMHVFENRTWVSMEAVVGDEHEFHLLVVSDAYVNRTANSTTGIHDAWFVVDAYGWDEEALDYDRILHADLMWVDDDGDDVPDRTYRNLTVDVSV